MPGINFNFDLARRGREKRQRARDLLSSYAEANPDLTLSELQEAMGAIDKAGEVPLKLSSGRDIGGLTLARPGRGNDEDQPGRIFTVDPDTGQIVMVNEKGTPAPLGEDFGGLRKKDRIVTKPRPRTQGETPAEKVARDTIQKYMSALDDYENPEDVPQELTANFRAAAESLGIPVEEATEIVKKRGPIGKFFGLEDVTRTTTRLAGPGGGGARGNGTAGGGGERTTYASEADVRKAYREGKITREKAVRLLRSL